MPETTQIQGYTFTVSCASCGLQFATLAEPCEKVGAVVVRLHSSHNACSPGCAAGGMRLMLRGPSKYPFQPGVN